MESVWVTRAQPGAAATAQRLAALAFGVVVEPLLTVRPLTVAIDLSDVAALAFTSANGVRAFARLSDERGLAVFAVGDATAAAARAAGFAKVRSAQGDVHGLAALIGDSHAGGSILHPGAAQPAGDLAGLLAAAGVIVRRQVLYDVDEAVLPAAQLERALACGHVLLHSPRAARALARLLADRAAPALTAICISPAAAEPLQRARLAAVMSAPLPNEEALLNLLGSSPA